MAKRKHCNFNSWYQEGNGNDNNIAILKHNLYNTSDLHSIPYQRRGCDISDELESDRVTKTNYRMDL